MKRSLFSLGAGAALTLVAAIVGVHFAEAQTHTPPRYQADVNWPKPLPNRWILGGLGGLCVDADHLVPVLVGIAQGLQGVELPQLRQRGCKPVRQVVMRAGCAAR